MAAELKSQVYDDTNGDRSRRELGLPGIQVELLDDTGEVFRQLGLSAQDTRQLRADIAATDVAATMEDASESGDKSGGLVDSSEEQAQPGRESRDASIGREFTSRPVGRSPVVSRGSR
jgi:hypothetical protein